MTQSWPVDRKVDLVLKGMQRRRPVTELCREAGISPTQYYRWRQEFIDAARMGLAQPADELGTLQERIQLLEVENAHLRRQVRLLQDLSVED
jgi:transposase-like protein